MITNIEDYFSKGCGRCARFATPDCSTRKWAAGLSALRRICLGAGLIETVKWGHPCYLHGDRNIALFGAFRSDFRLTFFNAALLSDPDGILQKQGPNARQPETIRFADNAQVAALEPAIRSLLHQSMAFAAAGIKPQKQASELELPDELVDALDNDPELAEAFRTLTPGRQRSYVINLSAAKTPATRITRIEKFRDKILAGKGALDR